MDCNFQQIDHLMASMTGSVLTSLLMTPMDVVKHRQQAQQAMASDYVRSVSQAQREIAVPSGAVSKIKQTSIIPEAWSVASPVAVPTSSQNVLPTYAHSQSLNLTHFEEVQSKSSFVRMHTGVIDVWCPKCNLNQGLTPQGRYGGMLDAFKQIFADEGIKGLWRGLSPTLVMAVPNTAVYFTLYDYIHGKQKQDFQVNTSIAAVLAGTCSRAFTSSLIAPLEQLRTRAQTDVMTNPGKKTSLFQSARLALQQRALFRGLSATLWRDVPFSAVYWMQVDAMRPLMNRKLSPQISNNQTRQSLGSFLSGAIGGSIASFVTQPFDMIKTRRQITMYEFPGSSFGDVRGTGTALTLEKIVKEEGLRGLYQGAVPRMLKITLSCAVMICTYDTVKRLLSEYRNNNKL